MNIPSTDETILQLMGSDRQRSSVERARMHDGRPLFTKDDIVRSRNNLDINLRAIFEHFQIGKTYFNDKAVEYYQKVEDRTVAEAKSDTQNLIRTLEKGCITDNRFEETLRTLGFEIVDRSVTIKDDVGELHTFSTSKTIREMNAARTR